MSRAGLDPDLLAELEEEQRFLARSLDDLDDELDAGDIGVDDHGELVDGYTRRLAEVTRSIDGQRNSRADLGPRGSISGRLLTSAGIVVLAVIAGALLAQASGFRSPSAALSGDIRRSSSDLLAEADTLTREGRWPEAVEVYEQALDLAPDNVEALTYRAWISSRLGESETSIADLGEAIAIDPNYPDARVFRAILANDAGRYDDAAADLAALDDLDVSPDMTALVGPLRSEITGVRIIERYGDAGEPIDLAELDIRPADAAGAGLGLVGSNPELAVRVLSAVLDAEPDNLTALVGKGNVLGTNPQFLAVPEVAAEGLALLDRAVELEPTIDEYRLYRAFARTLQGDHDGAADDLVLIDRARLAESLAQAYDEIAATVE